MAMQGFSVKKYLLFTYIEFLFSCSCIYCEARVILNLYINIYIESDHEAMRPVKNVTKFI